MWEYLSQLASGALTSLLPNLASAGINMGAQYGLSRLMGGGAKSGGASAQPSAGLGSASQAGKSFGNSTTGMQGGPLSGGSPLASNTQPADNTALPTGPKGPGGFSMPGAPRPQYVQPHGFESI